MVLPGGPWITVKLSVNPALRAFSCESLLGGRYINDDDRAVSTWSTSGHNRSRTGSTKHIQNVTCIITVGVFH